MAFVNAAVCAPRAFAHRLLPALFAAPAVKSNPLKISGFITICMIWHGLLLTKQLSLAFALSKGWISPSKHCPSSPIQPCLALLAPAVALLEPRRFDDYLRRVANVTARRRSRHELCHALKGRRSA